MPSFGDRSKASLAKCHPLIQKVMNEAIKETDFQVLDSMRGRLDQTRAYQTGKSKAKFGQSAHNYIPAVAVDVCPYPVDWNDRKAFSAMAKIILRIAKEMKVPLRWGGDWNKDGENPGDRDDWDMPHFELDPWRDYAAKSKLYEG